MSLYCFCQEGDETKRSNLFKFRVEDISGTVGENIAGVILPTQMECVKTGVQQHLWVDFESQITQAHYPNVDVFECPLCGRKVAKG